MYHHDNVIDVCVGGEGSYDINSVKYKYYRHLLGIEFLSIGIGLENHRSSSVFNPARS